MHLNGYKDTAKLPAQVVDLSGMLTGTISISPTICSVSADGEKFVLVTDVDAAGIAVLERTSLQPVGYMGASHNGHFVEAVSGVVVNNQSSGTAQYAHNFGDSPVTVDTATLGPVRGSRHNVSSGLTQGAGRTIAHAKTISAVATGGIRRFSNARNRVVPPTINTTYPTLADPGTLAGFADGGATGSGGVLAAQTHYAKLAWITRTNIYRSTYGITLPSTAISASRSANDAWLLDIPALPTNAIGYAIFHSLDNTTYYLVGASNAVGTDAFSIKAAYGQLAAVGTPFSVFGGMDKIVFEQNGGTALNGVDYSLASPVDLASNITVTSAVLGLSWSPWYRDSTLMKHYIRGTGNGIEANIDKISLIGASNSLNQTISESAYDGAGIPWRYDGSSHAVLDVPELAAVAFMWSATLQHRVDLFSAITGERLWSYAVPIPSGFYCSASGGGNAATWGAFQTIEGVTYFVYLAWWLRSVIRVPVRIAAA